MFKPMHSPLVEGLRYCMNLAALRFAPRPDGLEHLFPLFLEEAS
jgi:peptide methionine sulfoxide reductase MsrB